MSQVSLKDISDRIDYGLTASSSKIPQGPKFLRITDIVNGSLDENSVPYASSENADIDRYLLHNGDIIIARTGASVGTSHRFTGSGDPFVFASYLVRFRISHTVNSQFVGYLLKTDEWWEYINSEAYSKSAQPGLSASGMSNFTFDLPNRKVQDAIAEVLSALDDKIAVNSVAISSLTELQSTLWKQATASTTKKPLVNFVESHLGGTPKRSDDSAWTDEVAWASVKDMSAANHGIIVETAEGISTEASESARRMNPLPSGSVFLSARGTVGLVTTNTMPCAINQSAYAFIPPEGKGPALRLSIESLVDRLRARAHGSTFSTITKQDLRESSIPDLNSPEVESLGPALADLEDLRVAKTKESRTLAATRDELLPLLMSGKITVADAEKRITE